MTTNFHNASPFYKFQISLFHLFVILFPIADILTANRPSLCGLPSVILVVVFLLFFGLPSLLFHSGLGANKAWRLTTWLALLWIALCILSTIRSINTHLSFFGLPGEYQGMVPLISYALLFLLGLYTVLPDDQRPLIRSIAFGSILPATYGILQHLHHVPGIQYLSRSTSFFCNADFFGTYIALILLFTITLYLSGRSRFNILYLPLTGLQTIALLDSLTRSAWLGAFVSLVLFFALSLYRRRLVWPRILTISALVLFCIITMNQQSHSIVTSRAASIAVDTHRIVTNQNSGYAGSSRWFIWKDSLPLVKDHFFTGSGPDTFELVFHPEASDNHKYLHDSDIENENNNYLQIAVTLGMPALLTLLALFYRVFASAASIRYEKTDNDFILSAGLLSALIGYIVQAGFNIDVITVAPLFWLVLGISYRRFTGVPKTILFY